MIVQSLIRPTGVALLALLPVLVHAQPAMEAAADARLRLGPLTLDPRLAIRNIGVDTNVFNDADAPVRDFTAAFGPEVDSWIRVGRLSWSGTSQVTWNYYRDSSSQRSFDAGQSGRLELALGRLTPYATGSIERTRQRPNVEIDARVRRETSHVAAGIDLLVGAKLTLGVEYGERVLDYADGEFGGVSLGEALDRREAAARLTARYVMTPLTTLVVQASREEHRFQASPERNSDSVRLMPGLEFKPLALISGRAAVGVRRFDPRSSDLPGFLGVVSDVELSYLLRDMTRFSVQVQRDIDYSFEPVQPYYVSTGAQLSVIQAIGANWDIQARAGRTNLGYRGRTGPLSGAGRVDRLTAYGVGFGRRFGTDVRLGLDVEHLARTSDVAGRAYEGLRGGGSFTYGF